MKVDKKILMSYIKSCYVYVKFNESCSSSKISQSMLNGTLRNGN